MGIIDDECTQNVLDMMPVYLYTKDKDFRYTYCNENMARIAGLDTTEQLIGKKDEECIWGDRAELYYHGDRMVMAGKPWVNTLEKLTTCKGEMRVLVSKNRLFNNLGETIGITGVLVDVSGNPFFKQAGDYNIRKKHYELGSRFNNEYITSRELQVLKLLIYGFTANKIGKRLYISPKTVESHIDNIKIKLQVETKGEIMLVAIKEGFLSFLIDGNMI